MNTGNNDRPRRLHKLIDSLADDQIGEETVAAIREGLDDVEHGRVMDVQEYRRLRGL